MLWKARHWLAVQMPQNYQDLLIIADLLGYGVNAKTPLPYSVMTEIARMIPTGQK
jgi:hypothetical protein